MIKSIWYSGADETALCVRKAICGTTADSYDKFSQTVVLYDGDTAVGTGRLYFDTAFFTDCIGVLPEFRGVGFGDLLVRNILWRARDYGQLNILMPQEFERFFAKYGAKWCGAGYVIEKKEIEKLFAVESSLSHETSS